MIAWCFQTAGILLGAHWAYAVLGWGGYWGWDPVENASLLPWLTGTAFLHSVMMQEKRGMMKVWNVWLVFLTFMLCILGTTLTRSGIVSSVHAFAQSSIGNWFVGFLVLILVVCLAAYLKNRDYLKSENQLDSMISRESSFLFNNLILLVSCVAVLSGTLFPGVFGMVVRIADQRWHAVLQQGEHSARVDAAVSDRRWAAAGVAEDFHGQPEAQFRLAAVFEL